MDINMLFEAARDGKVEILESLLQENPSILAEIRLISFTESLLHVATKSGQLNFAHELMKFDPGVARELNKDGFQPLDIAVILGNLEIVKTLLSFNRDLCRLKGKDNRIALHYAAVKGRVDIIHELLSICADCVEDVTFHGETALHLAVKYYQFEAFSELVKWLERLNKESIINIQDGDGNTVLHLAVSTKQYECLNIILDENCSIKGTIELNIPNGKNLTALDILDIDIQESYHYKARDILQRAGATRAQDSTTITSQHSPRLETNSQQPIQNQDHHPQPDQRSINWFEYFKFQIQRDSPSDTRNSLLVVAALIATVTFQAAVNPPSGLLDQSRRFNSTNQSARELFSAFWTDFMFVFFNTLGFTASSLIISYLTTGFPLYRELVASLFSMILSYSAATNISIGGTKSERRVRAMVSAFLFVAFILPPLMRTPPWLSKRVGGYWRRRAVRNAGLPVGN